MDNNQGGIQNVQGAADQPQANIYNQQPVDGQQQYMQQQYYQQQYEAQQQYYQQQYDMQQQYYQQQAYDGQQYVQQQAYDGQQYAQQQSYDGQQVYQQAYQQNYQQPAYGGNVSDVGNGSQNNGGKKKTGLIIGIIIAVLVVAAIIVTVIILKNKKDDKKDKEDKTTETTTSVESTETTAEATTVEGTVEDSQTEQQTTDSMNYVPDNPVIYENEVLTIEIVNIHRYDPGENYPEDQRYRWDIKVTNNRKKGEIYVDFLDIQYNNVVIGGRHFNDGSSIECGQSVNVSFDWLQFIDNYAYFGDAMSIKFRLLVGDDDYNTLLNEQVEFYAEGAEHDKSSVPDLTGLIPFLNYEGLKFFITDTYIDEYGYIEMEGFLVNESDNYYALVACYGDGNIYVNDVAFDRADRIQVDAPAHTTAYFQGWISMDEEYGAENGFNISIPYSIYNADNGEELLPEQQYSFSMPYKIIEGTTEIDYE